MIGTFLNYHKREEEILEKELYNDILPLGILIYT